jgi:hypothetical protein
VNLGESPVSVRGDERRNQLSNTEGAQQGEGRPLHEEKSMRTRDEDERLRDDCDLEINDHVQLRVGCDLHGAASEADAEFILEEGRLYDDDDERNSEGFKSARYL